MCQKIKTTVFFMWPASWSTDISLFYYSDINLFLIDYACCKLYNIWLLLFENNSRIYHYKGASYCRKNIIAVITQDRVIEDNLKRQIKKSNNFSKFFQVNNFSVDYAGLYKNWDNTSLFIIPGTLPTLKLPIKIHSSSRQLFFWCSFSIRLSWLQRRNKKINTILYDRCYLHLKKLQIIQNIQNLMFQVIFIFSDCISIKQIIVPSTFFCC